MYRLLFRYLIDGVIFGGALIVALRIGGRRFNFAALIGVIALLIILNILRSLPMLRILSAQDALRRTAKEENESDVLKIIDEHSKPSPLFGIETFLAAAFIIGLGFVMRLLH